MKILLAIGEGEVRDSFFTPKVLEELKKLGEVVFNETGRQGFTKEELIENIKDIDIIITGWQSPAIDADVLKNANKLKIHAHTGGSVYSYTSKEEYEKGIVVLSGNDTFAKSVAEGCLCMTLNSLRRNEEAMQSMRDGKWRIHRSFNQGLYRKKVGIVGFGMISRYFVELLRWFEPEIYIYSNYLTEEKAQEYGGKKASLEQIFSECEVISLHSAWTKETEGMISQKLIKMMRDRAVLVNTARGIIIDEQALIEELQTGRISASLDVFSIEPLPKDSKLRTLKNVQLYPHVAGPTYDMREQVTFQLIDDIIKIQQGESTVGKISYEHAKRMSVK